MSFLAASYIKTIRGNFSLSLAVLPAAAGRGRTATGGFEKVPFVPVIGCKLLQRLQRADTQAWAGGRAQAS